MKRSAGPALILIFLILAIGIFFVFRVSGKEAEEASGGSAAAATATAEPTATSAPTATPTEAPTATPAPTAKPTATPTPTAAPTSTPVPTAAPTAVPSYNQSGEFRSDSGANINIVVKWYLSGTGDYPTLKLDAYVSSYALQTGDRIGDVVFNVNGNLSYASSSAIQIDGGGLTESYLGSTSVNVSAGSDVPVNVTWYFNGTYSGKDISTITAESTIHIG